jgi:ribA/ribD-fused uncharacterized protein
MKAITAAGFCILVSALACAAAEPAPAHAVGRLRLIGVQTIPLRQPYQGTVIGGLSGLDYDPGSDRWVSESDDKSEFSPGRFYTLRLNYDEKSFAPVEVTGVTFFRQADGTTYPDKPHAIAHGGEVPDLESVRFDPRDGTIWYTSEGDRALGMNPFVRHAAPDGRLLGELPLPPMFRIHPREETGPRHNLSFEGLSFAPDGQTLWVGMEAPLYQDGAVPTTTAGAFSRVTHYDRNGRMLGQYAYPVDPIPVAPAPGGNADNGVSELLAVNDHEFLLIERSGTEDAAGAYHFNIRLYDADFAGATEIGAVPALAGAVFLPAKKRLVQDFNRLGRPWVDNLEGITWGRRLANGHDTLVLVSDDNFSEHQQTQFWVFEVLPDTGAPAATRRWDEKFEGVVQDRAAILGFVEDYRWLSNFLPCRVEWEGRVYGSAEAAYQSAKYAPAERDVFLQLDPDAAKKLTRAKPYEAVAWETRKEQVMRAVVWAKFSQNPDLAAKLLATGDRRLAETNWWGDAYWGVYEGEGKNVLGQILMDARARLTAAAAGK